MNHHDNLQFRDYDNPPASEALAQILRGSYEAYEALQEALPGLEIEQDWQWYTPYKVWAAKGQHFWMTARGTRKEKNLYWLHIFEGYFSIAVWFKSKNREEILLANISNKTKQLIHDAQPMGKLPTFPVVFNVATTEPLADIYTLLDCKKRLER